MYGANLVIAIAGLGVRGASIRGGREVWLERIPEDDRQRISQR
jgi:hypothetical protein